MIHESNCLDVSYSVAKVAVDGDENGLATIVTIGAKRGASLLSMTMQEWTRLCDLTVLDRDAETLAAYHAKERALRDLMAKVGEPVSLRAGESLKAELRDLRAAYQKMIQDGAR